MYADYISSPQLAEEIEGPIGRRRFGDTPEDMPRTADMLIDMVYYAWISGSLGVPQRDPKPEEKVQLTPNKWASRALGLMTATGGDAWRSIYGERDIMAR